MSLETRVSTKCQNPVDFNTLSFKILTFNFFLYWLTLNRSCCLKKKTTKWKLHSLISTWKLTLKAGCDDTAEEFTTYSEMLLNLSNLDPTAVYIYIYI